MAKENNAIYAPGELDRVRGNLGSLDADEAKRMAKLLGGDVGTEKAATASASRKAARTRAAGVPSRDASLGAVKEAEGLVGAVPEAQDTSRKKKKRQKDLDSGDNPQVPVKATYRERLKMDRYAAQAEFDIKSLSQVLRATFSFFKEAPDYVSPVFVTKRLNEYYKQIELVVISTRTMFPRNNLKRNEQMKRMSLFAFTILDTIRYWNIERIASVIARVQRFPHQVRIVDCADIVRDLYRPLFILDKLSFEQHITEAYKLLYKFLYIENPMEAKEKYQKLIRDALDAYKIVRKDIQYLLYPLFLKLVSDRWISYDQFFSARKNRIMAFLGVREEDRIPPNMAQAAAEEAGQGATEEDQEKAKRETQQAAARQTEEESERKALERGLRTLESLFPQAGWNKLDDYPDLYAYFAIVFGLGKGYELIAPEDPLLQVVILMRILDELLAGLRSVSFSTIVSSEGVADQPIGQFMEEILEQWRDFESTFMKEYLNRLQEYCRLLDTSVESASSPYAKRIYVEMQWLKRLCYLPYYKIEKLSTCPFKKSSVSQMYPEVRKLRRCLGIVAGQINEAAKKATTPAGESENLGPCQGIDNPWISYVFQVSNPLSL
ncbi:MAG: hypothetical protein LBD74_04975, partial [Spirochaetaceae bacterium]|nr:hypothetical protein [Spirochaetaceae bacterium]